MKAFQHITLITTLSLAMTTQAAELVTKLTGAIEHTCSIQVTVGENSVIYRDFTSAVNKYKSLNSAVPANQRYMVKNNGYQKEISLNAHTDHPVVGDTHSNCMSLALAQNPVFAFSADAKRYLLETDNSFIDICWSNFDGAVGLSRTITKTGTDEFAESSEHMIAQNPGLEINLAKRSVINEATGSRLSLNPTDLLTQRSSLFITGEGQINQNIGEINLQVHCTTQQRNF